MMKLKMLINMLVLLSLFICTTCATAGEIQKCRYIMGYDRWIPYQYKDTQGKPTGLDIELISAIFKNAGCKLVLEGMPWKRHLIELKIGKVHLAAGASKSPERERFAYFSEPYRFEMVALYVRRGEYDKFNFNNLSDIQNSSFSLGATLGYYYGDEYSKLMKNPDFNHHVQEVPYDSINYDKLLSYRIDGFLADPIATAAGLRKKKLLDKIEKHPMRVYSTNIFVMFSKKLTTPEDVDRFNNSLAELKKNGEYDEIMKKYIK